MNGRVQVYEINTNPSTSPPKKKHPNAIRTRSQALAWERYCAALAALDDTDPDGPAAPVFEHEILIRRRWSEAAVTAEVARR